ncbi:MAG TPA: hypothetical protein VFF02_20755 [Anaeromyxobacteraceae bacterium]|nr:hypothetical protein [Anaeromyxobacteraceae bacterium]
MTRTRSLHTLVALALLVPAPTTLAAEVTRVLSAAEPDDPFDLDVTLTWRHTTSRGKITRELCSTYDPTTGTCGPGGSIIDATELGYTRTADVPVARLAVGLYQDLELHVELPWVLGDDKALKYGSGVSDANSSIHNEVYDASGNPCPGGAGSCPIFPVPQTGYHGKTFGDVLVGIAWGILSEQRDDTKPTWVVGLDVTLPTATRYDPSTAPLSYDKSNPAAVGERIWRYDIWTALSKQFGAVDPYVRLHASLPARSGTTYSNCDNAASLAANTPPQPQMAVTAPAGCAAWGEAAAARPPRVLGMAFGTELVAHENKREQQRVAFDLRVGAEWTSDGRWYNELTDATGKLMHSDAFATLHGLAGAYLRASSSVQFRLYADFRWQSDHYISGEPLSRAGVAADNPNYDWRYDTVGRRFRISESTVLDLGGSFMFSF